ncbi:unnamed protein product [Clonostachys byssicola]|uniref:Uncharacterized protein n=1 Tax=Clonostachys byssicola TaxID=160290 RepID=A0A9N9UZ90_9HYPO|nr:unnamed protein product [Clonostachys byssicola]
MQQRQLSHSVTRPPSKMMKKYPYSILDSEEVWSTRADRTGDIIAGSVLLSTAVLAGVAMWVL